MISFKVRNLDPLKRFLKTVPQGGVKAGLKAFVEYIIGNASHGLKHDEPQKYVSRKQAGYKTSRRMMAYFFAVGILEKDSQGGVILNRYKRTGETANSWAYNVSNNGYAYAIRNPKAGAYWTRDNDNQTTQHAMAGRRTVAKVIADNLAGAKRAMDSAVRKVLGSK